jgi:hypothetical protein
MRSAPELIAELEEAGSQFWLVQIVVGFENSTVFITASDANRLSLLQEAIDAGGQPIGMMAIDKSQGSLKILHTIYPENEEDAEWIEKYLENLDVSVARSFVDKYGGEITPCDERLEQ